MLLELEPNAKGSTHLEIEVDYHKGGMNMFAGASERRGIYVHVTPVEMDGRIKRFGLFSGNKSLLEELGRANAKKLAAHQEQVERDVAAKTGKVHELISHVLSKNGLSLKQDVIVKLVGIEGEEAGEFGDLLNQQGRLRRSIDADWWAETAIDPTAYAEEDDEDELLRGAWDAVKSSDEEGKE